MPGCSVVREVRGCTAIYTMSGRFDGACAWDLGLKLGREALREVVLDFSRVGDFVDYAIAIVANGLLGLNGKAVQLRGLRKHQERVFKYFGVDVEELSHPAHALSRNVLDDFTALAREVE